MSEGKRYNSGKVRYDLLPNFAINQMACVLSEGAKKYAERNWELGMEWSKCIASLKRHIEKFESGQDYDEETGLLHIAHAMTNCAFLTEYYKIYPQGDNRQHSYLNTLRIGLDIDDVLCDFVGAYAKKFNCDIPSNWSFSYETVNHLSKLISDKEQMEEFYMSMLPKMNPNSIPFIPICYITQRSIPTEITKMWLELNKFPCVPVFTVGHNEDKIKVAKENQLDIFIDDRFETFAAMNRAGICTFLFDAEHNKSIDVGYKRIFSLNDIFKTNKYTI